MLTAALEAGVSTFLFDAAANDAAQAWQSLARFRTLHLTTDGQLSDPESQQQA